MVKHSKTGNNGSKTTYQTIGREGHSRQIEDAWEEQRRNSRQLDGCNTSRTVERDGGRSKVYADALTL